MLSKTMIERLNKQINLEQAIDLIKDGDTILIGGFLGVGSPHRLIDALVKRQGFLETAL